VLLVIAIIGAIAITGGFIYFRFIKERPEVPKRRGRTLPSQGGSEPDEPIQRPRT